MKPETLFFAKTHEWVAFRDDNTALIGISDFAQHELGDIVFVNLPEEGDSITGSIAFADVESVKAVSDIISPVTGIVSKINEELLDSPEKINESPYESWFVEVKDISAKEELMSYDEYTAFIKKED
jgi:glycine cleavage system H protein